jgi:non-heme chloroperoxidase
VDDGVTEDEESGMAEITAHGVTEILEMPGRGHSLTIDGGWREVADTVLAFVQRFAQP